jgi:hypothetical protein
VQNVGAKSLGTKKQRQAARHRSDWKKKMGEVVDRRWAEWPWEEEEEEKKKKKKNVHKVKRYGFLWFSFLMISISKTVSRR